MSTIQKNVNPDRKLLTYLNTRRETLGKYNVYYKMKLPYSVFYQNFYPPQPKVLVNLQLWNWQFFTKNTPQKCKLKTNKNSGWNKTFKLIRHFTRIKFPINTATLTTLYCITFPKWWWRRDSFRSCEYVTAERVVIWWWERERWWKLRLTWTEIWYTTFSYL